MEHAIGLLESRGYVVRRPRDLYASDGYLAGEDEYRAEQFMALMTDPEVDVVFAAAGGYGAMRMLPFVDFDQLGEPKITTGFSDITTLHSALWTQCGWTTFHTPNLIDGFGRSGPDEKTSSRAWFWRLMEADGEDFVVGTSPVPEDPEAARCPVPTAMQGGTAQGRLVGGNLSLVSALVGTPYELKTDGCLLFLEDVGERPYRIDRMLSQMQLAGQLDSLAGVILGQFTDCEDENPEGTWDVERVLRHYFEGLEIPVVMNFPSGHDYFNSALPLGYQTSMDADSGEVRILEPLWR